MGYKMTIYSDAVNNVIAKEGLGVVYGAYAAKQTLSGTFGGLFRGALSGAVSAFMLGANTKLASVAASVGIAASGWSSLARGNLKMGLAKIFIGSAIGVGSNAALKEQDIAKTTLGDAAVVSGCVAGAGLVQATVEGIWPYVEPVLIGVGKCIRGAFTCCTRIAETVEDCTKRRDHRPQAGSAIRYY